LQRAFNHGQPTSIRLTVSPPGTPNIDAVNAEPLPDGDSRSRQSSTGTTITVSSDEGLTRKKTRSSEPIVAVYLTPLKDELGKAGMFVFVLATGT
jgi:hypothetical protein